MRVLTKRLAGLCLVLLPVAAAGVAGPSTASPSAAGGAAGSAAAPAADLRLIEAMAERDTARMRVLLADEGLDVNAARADGATALLWAAHWDDGAAVELLLGAGADVNAADDHGVTPLARACENASASMVERLLAAGANPNAAQVNGLTPLMTAARTGSLEVVDALLARGADPNARMTASDVTEQGFVRNGAFDTFATGTGDVAGATPLWVAAFATNPGPGRMRNGWSTHRSTGDVLRSLLAAGAQPEIRSNDGTTPMMAAAGCGRWGHWTNTPRASRQPMAEEAFRILIAAGVDVNATNEGDFTALHCAAFSGLNELVQLLVEHGADIDARDWRGRTAYRLAEGAKQSFHYQAWPEVAALLAELGADTRLGIPGTIHERLRGLLAAR